jgi:aryl-alcohol dehydrogenase-like predicted oxidoreductase
VGYGEADVRAAFSAAIASGVRLFDSAEIYGQGDSERLLGKFVRESGRDDVQVATKFFPFPWRLFQRGALISALRASLQRLGLPQVALYQIHWSLPLLRGDFWAPDLAEAVQSGLARAVGVSNYDARNLRRVHAALAKRGVPLVSNQVAYSLLDRAPERNGVLAACRELNVELIAYSPLAMGLLGGRYSPAHPPTGIRRVRTLRRLKRAVALLPALREIGAAHGGKTSAQVALNWLICKGAIPIPGAKNEVQARENAGALGWQLGPDELARLDRLAVD